MNTKIFQVMYLDLILLSPLPRDLDKKRIVVMRIGDNAPTEEQIETTNPELRRLISTETYLEEQSDMDRQVREQNLTQKRFSITSRVFKIK